MPSDELDNPVWSSLSSTHAHLAVGGGGPARIYPRDVSPFGGLADPDDPASWSAMGDLLDGEMTVLIAGSDHVPAGWEVTFSIPGVQMVGNRLRPEPAPDLSPLGPDDVPEMLDLVKRAQPGPFLPRTVEMGKYLGRREGGALIAMGGMRLHPAGWTELSAICTDAAYRGLGLASRLIRALAVDIFDAGRRPFLHTGADNHSAIRLYRHLGFELRRPVAIIGVRERR